MKLVSPESLHTNRVYFTEFDRITYSQVAWSSSDVEAIILNLERKLKLLALTKGQVVIAASHLLESELAREVLLPHPKLFSKGIVVPALRSEFTGFEDFLDAKLSEGKEASMYEGAERREAARVLDEQVAVAAIWNVGETAGRFRERLIAEIEDEQSLLRSCLREAGVVVPGTLTTQIAAVPSLSRQDVYNLAKQTGDKALWQVLCEYADFVYYLTGAVAVRSEGVLPQENLMDFSLSDLAGGRTHLSETEVFFKIFVDLVKAATHTLFPVDLLDCLSMDEVLDLHSVAVAERFVTKYNQIQQKVKDGLTVHDPERLVLLMEELEEFEQQLHTTYGAAISAEMPAQARATKGGQAARFLNSTASLLVPAWGMVTGLKDMIVSGLELAGYGEVAKRVGDRISSKLRAWHSLLDTGGLSGKPVLLGFVRRLQERYTDIVLGESAGHRNDY
jgi:hypothetical protein